MHHQSLECSSRVSGFKPKLPCSFFSRVSELFVSSHVFIGRQQPSAKHLWTAALLVMARQTGHRRHKGHFSPTPLHTPTLTPQSVLGWRQAVRIMGQWDRRGGGFRGPSHRHSELPLAVETVCQPYCPAAPSFFIHLPLCPPPFVLLYHRLWVEVLMFTHLQAPKKPQIIIIIIFFFIFELNRKTWSLASLVKCINYILITNVETHQNNRDDF